MNLYARDDERAIRTQRLVEDWTRYGLLDQSQRDRILPTLQVDLRRTNRFLRATLFVFGFIIVQSLAGLIAVTLDLNDEDVLKVLALVGAVSCFAGAQLMVTRYRLYHFGVEEAVAIASLVFVVIFAGTILRKNDFSTLAALVAGAAGAYALFLRFGYVYAGIGATVLAPMVIFDIRSLSDTTHRLVAFTLLLTIFFIARERRIDHDNEHPGDSYSLIAAVAWAAMYFDANLKVSGWWSTSDNLKIFEWSTYVVIWLVPAAGLWLAIRDRDRALLDVNIVLALITLLSNKAYLGKAPMPWDPILLGLLLIAVAIGLRRWLVSGPDGSRAGFTPKRLLTSERQRLAMIGSATVLAPGAPPAHAQTHTSGPALGGGGSSGGAGASGSF